MSLSDSDEKILYDAYEKRPYTNYNNFGPVCKLTPPDGQPENCNSKDEFDAFVAEYMND